MTLMEKILQQTKREYSPRKRGAALFFEGIFFLAVLPYVLAALAALLDHRLHLLRFAYGSITLVLGWLLIAGGWLLAAASIYIQFTLGRGTPVPLMATQKLVVRPPYTFCRNPMALGAIVLYFGMSVLWGSFSALGLVLLGAAGLLVFIKRFEEKELEARFGDEYVRYKQRTPFLIPRFRK